MHLVRKRKGISIVMKISCRLRRYTQEVASEHPSTGILFAESASELLKPKTRRERRSHRINKK